MAPPRLQARQRDIEEDPPADPKDGDDQNKLSAKDRELESQITSSLKDDDDDAGDGPDNAAVRREQARDKAPVDVRDDDLDREIEDDQDTRLAYDLGDDGAPEERGGYGSRRKRRNRARRVARDQDRAVITELQARLGQLQGVVDQVTRGQVGLAAGDLDTRISNTQQQLTAIDAALAKAVKDGDDVTYAQAMRLRDEARDRLQQFGYAKQRLLAEAGDGQRRAAPQGQGAPRPAAPDPTAAAYSEVFMRRHDWFDPADPADEDSMIVKAIDDALANEGYRPNTKMYWVELERRVKARGLGRTDDREDDVREDEDDGAGREREERRPARREGGGLPPRSGRGSGRGPGSGGRFTLTPDMRDALDAEGLLDEKNLTDDQKKYRRRLVSTWQDGFKRLEAGRGR